VVIHLHPTLALIPQSLRNWLTDDRKILVVVGGLLFIAVALTLLTVRYWRLTRPVRALAPQDDEPVDRRIEPTPGPPVPTVQPEPAPAEPERAPEPEPTAVHEPVTTEPVAPTEQVSEDHRSADEEWEPRGTGEHERIEVPKRATARPSRAGRRSVLDRQD
jgi:hypothetical protein